MRAPVAVAIPTFSAWKDGFPAGVFIDGATVFNGKTYDFPLTSNQRYSTMLFYAQDRMQKAGYDPAIKAAQAQGAKVARDDGAFPNWDPTEDDTAAGDQALSG